MLISTATLAIALVLQAPAGAAPSQRPGRVAHSGPFTAARFREHAAFLASDELQGRKAGSAAAARAAEYIAARFEEARLVPAGDGRTYFQAFTLPDGSRCRNVLGVLPARARWPGSTSSSRPTSITWGRAPLRPATRAMRSTTARTTTPRASPRCS